MRRRTEEVFLTSLPLREMDVVRDGEPVDTDSIVGRTLASLAPPHLTSPEVRKE
jgi:hypothetical protein